MGSININKLKYLLSSLLAFLLIEAKGQYYMMDTIPQEYEILSIQNSRKARLENWEKRIKMCKEWIEKERKFQQDYHKIQKQQGIKHEIYKKEINEAKLVLSKLKKSRRKLRNPQYNKNGYVLLLKKINTGQLFDVAVVKMKHIDVEKLKPNCVYNLKLYKVYEKDIIKDIDRIWWVDMDSSSVSIAGKSWTRNIYVSPNLKGLKYNPQANFSNNILTNSKQESQ